MAHTRSFTYSLALAAFLAGAFMGSACGRTPETVAEVHLRAVRTGTPRPTKAPSPIPTLTNGPGPTASPPLATPSPSPIGYTGRQVIVSGSVYGADGAALTGVTVMARSLDAGAPYVRTATSDAGSFVFNGVPEGVLVELVASRPGWTTRRRVAAFQGQSSLRHEVAFGAPDGREGDGAAHFLSDRPEIVRTDPADGATGVGPEAGTFRLVLSEPLPAEDRRRLEAAIRILPADDVANGSLPGTTTDLRALADAAWPQAVTVDGAPAVAPYAIRKGSAFRNDPATRATCTWSADGREVMLRCLAPMLTSRDGNAAYQLVLVSGGPDQRIRDADGRQLGCDADGRDGAYPPRGDLVGAAFARTDLALRDLAGLPAGPAERWAATHASAARFTLAADDDAPDLLAVAAAVQGPDTRLELTFSEPMAAFDGDQGFVGPDLGDDAGDLAAYTFAIAKAVRDADGTTLDGEAALAVDPRVTPQLDLATHGERELAFAPEAFVTERVGATAGSVLVELDPFDARRVALVVIGRPDFLGPGVAYLKARARVSDPAGNRMREGEADRQVALVAL